LETVLYLLSFLHSVTLYKPTCDTLPVGKYLIVRPTFASAVNDGQVQEYVLSESDKHSPQVDLI